MCMRTFLLPLVLVFLLGWANALDAELRVRHVSLQGEISSALRTRPFLVSGVGPDDTALYFAAGESVTRSDPTSAVYSIHNLTGSVAHVSKMRAGTASASGPHTLLNYATGEPGRRTPAVYGTIVSPGSTRAMGFAGGAVAPDEHISSRFCLVSDAWKYDVDADQYVALAPDARWSRRGDICHLDAERADEEEGERPWMPAVPLYTWFDATRGAMWVLGDTRCNSKTHSSHGIRACDLEHTWRTTLDVWRLSVAGSSRGRPSWKRMARGTSDISEPEKALLAMVSTRPVNSSNSSGDSGTDDGDDTVPFVVVARDGTLWQFVGGRGRGQWLPRDTRSSSCTPDTLSRFAQSRSSISTETGESWALGLHSSPDKHPHCAELCHLRIDTTRDVCDVQCYVDSRVTKCPAIMTRAMWAGKDAVWALGYDGTTPTLLEYRIHARTMDTVEPLPVEENTATSDSTSTATGDNSGSEIDTIETPVSQTIASADFIEPGILAAIITVPIGGMLLIALLVVGFAYLHNSRPRYYL